jgi:cytochrome c oxidase subunit III
VSEEVPLALPAHREEVQLALPSHREEVHLDSLPIDDSRGTFGMKLFIASEAFVFISLFFAYFYLGHRHSHWPSEMPKLAKALAMLGVLLASSVVLHAAEKSVKKHQQSRGRLLLGATIVLAFVFLGIQLSEYREHLLELTPRTNSYGSIFYTLTSFHAAHLIVGLGMLIFVFCLPRLEPRQHAPHKPLHNTALYWHFVDVVWVFIVGLLYVLPYLKA